MTSSWNTWFLQMACHVSTKSKDPSTKCGAVIARPNGTVVSIGYNGFPMHMQDTDEWYTSREEKYSRIVHAEMNALIFARQSIENCVLYTWPFAPCDRCCVQMLQAGIKCFVFPAALPDIKARWEESINRSKKYILECGAHYLEIPRGEVD
jgi:dCMP deaminase